MQIDILPLTLAAFVIACLMLGQDPGKSWAKLALCFGVLAVIAHMTGLKADQLAVLAQ